MLEENEEFILDLNTSEFAKKEFRIPDEIQAGKMNYLNIL